MRIKQRILKEEPGGVNWELELYYFCHWENGMFVTGTENHKLAKGIGIGLDNGIESKENWVGSAAFKSPILDPA